MFNLGFPSALDPRQRDPLLQYVQNDNVPPDSRYGTSSWDTLGAQSSQPTEMNNFYGAAAVRPHVMTPSDVWLRERNRATVPANINPFRPR